MRRQFAIVFKLPLDTPKKDVWKLYKQELCEKFSTNFYSKIAIDEPKIIGISSIEYKDEEFENLMSELTRKTKALEEIKHQLEETGGLDDIEDRGEMLKWVNQALKVSDE